MGTALQMDKRFYIKAGSKILGPFERKQLDSLYARGRIRQSHLISTDRFGWKSFDDFLSSTEQPSLQAGPIHDESEWYYALNERRMGPCDWDQLQSMFQAGELPPETLVWREGMPRWVPAANIPDLDFRELPPLPSLTITPDTPSLRRICLKCGMHDLTGGAFCSQCGSPYKAGAERQLPLAAGGDRKDRLVAALLAFFLGGFGVHHFYLGNVALGVLYLLFCWTFIPAIISFIEGIVFLCTGPESFDSQYNTRH